MAWLQAVASFALDTIYPRTCAGCGKQGTWLCSNCDRAVPRFAQPWCSRCGVPVALGRCRCATTPESLAVTRSLGPFDGWLREAIHQVKYQGEWGRAAMLGDELARALADELRCDVIVPVPLHPARLKQRGFNQAQLIAARLERHLDTPVEPLLVRARRTGAQVHLDASKRMSNVAGAFQVDREGVVDGRSVLLVDDVVTTGATLGSCAAALITSGATAVSAATLAREL